MTDCKTNYARNVHARTRQFMDMHFYLHAGRIPEGYRKDTGRVTDPLTDLLTDPLTDLLTDPLTGKLRQAWRLGPPEGYRKDSRPFW